jgi:hypothetical protein
LASTIYLTIAFLDLADWILLFCSIPVQSLFTYHPNHRLEAEKVLENYLTRRVTNMMYQVRLEAVTVFYNNQFEDCDDTRAHTIQLTEEQYLTCRIGWCNKAVWAWLSKYWTSDEIQEKERNSPRCSPEV